MHTKALGNVITYERTSDAAFTEDRPGKHTPLAFRRWFLGLGLIACDFAIVARDGGQVVGVFRYTRWHRELVCAGTWVDRHYRRQGIASELWWTAARLHRTRRFDVVAVSKEGRAFIQRMTEEGRDCGHLTVRRRPKQVSDNRSESAE